MCVCVYVVCACVCVCVCVSARVSVYVYECVMFREEAYCHLRFVCGRSAFPNEKSYMMMT